ncbi:hypothetical protein RD792_018145 [Penstemon davidsonii]|uniref:TIR domain-containing protein n=1 Tax=Penstemon davidsonii TaxID=160366 RepID=A0ABR0DUY3_9LAMI|nr:hypothetical protein RD792_018145 [Penstemon davidsonii]
MTITVSAAKPSSVGSRCSYHVLLTFKSNNSTEIFVDKLYIALMESGIHTFRNCDKHETRKGFSLEMIQAVKQSEISVVIFSKEYAYSTWCLDQLVNILERKEKMGHMILPVFYDVDPSHVRKQTGCYANVFLEYEDQIMATRVQQWRSSLRDVANLGGMVLENGHESKLIQEIVERTWIKLSHNVFNVAPYLIGVYSRIKKISIWLQDDLSNLPISVMYGAGGIGKTTIAKILYQLYHERFELSSFIANIKEITNIGNGLVNLQNHILSDILKQEKVDVHDVDQGILQIKEALCCRRFLFVLDDVDQMDQLNAVLGLRDWFSAGSKIIITTRNEILLNPPVNYFSYKVNKLDSHESLQLFSWHAFKHEHPMKGYMELSKKLVHRCQGLPLALQVLGSSLLDATKDMWEVTSEKLNGISDSQTLKILGLGYDNLHDDQEKNLFLDIACFFVGKDKDYVIRILDESDFYARAGIQILIEKCLLTISQQNKLLMHRSIKEMSEEVIRQESLGQLGKYNRLWDSKNALTVLREKSGTESIEGLNLDLHEDRNGFSFEDCDDNLMWNLEGNPSKRLCFSFLYRFTLISSLTVSGSMSNTERLSADAFSNLHNLRLLQLRNVQLFGSCEGFPKKLKWLCWHNFQSSSFPRDFPMDNLSIIEMHSSNLQRICEGTKILRSLKVLDLSHSHCLTRTPDFSGLPRLEKLILEDCINLVKVRESIGRLDRLLLLNLKGCENLKKLPKEIEGLKSLGNLNLSGCLNLDFAKAINKDMPSRNDGRNHNPIVTLPDNIKDLTSVHILEIVGCTQLELLPELPSSLKMLDARSCKSLKIITNLPNCLRSLELQLKDCEELVEIEKIFKLKPITCMNNDRFLNLWVGIDFVEGIEMEFSNNLTCTTRKGPVQGLYEFGIFSTFFPGNTVPIGFNKSSIDGYIRLTVPPLPKLKRQGLDICVVYMHNKKPCEKHYIIISNVTKRITWIYSPIVFVQSGSYETILWLSRWTFGDQLERGDEVIISLDMSCDVKEFGVRHFNDEVVDEEDSQVQGHPSSRHVIGMDISEYRLSTDVYLLTHVS